MIRTKTAQVIDSRTGETAIIYLTKVNQVSDTDKNVESFYIVSATMQEDGTLKQFGETIIATYKKSTYLALFGAMTLQEFSDNEDANMIAQIDYATAYTPTGNEVYPAPKFWGLTSADLEIVV